MCARGTQTQSRRCDKLILNTVIQQQCDNDSECNRTTRILGQSLGRLKLLAHNFRACHTRTTTHHLNHHRTSHRRVNAACTSRKHDRMTQMFVVSAEIDAIQYDEITDNILRRAKHQHARVMECGSATIVGVGVKYLCPYASKSNELQTPKLHTNRANGVNESAHTQL